MSEYDRTIYLIEGVEQEVDASLLWDYSKIKIKVTGEPAWFQEITDVNLYASYFDILPPLDGTYTYSIDVWNIATKTFIETATLTLIVADIYNDISICCSDNNTNIVWINRQGGWQNYIFTQRFDNGVDIGTAKTFINNGVVKYADRGRIYNNKTVYVTGLTKTEIDYLDTLRYSIQAYEYNPTTTVFTPILLDSSNFNKYNSKENMYEFNLTYKYAAELDIQTQ